VSDNVNAISASIGHKTFQPLPNNVEMVTIAALHIVGKCVTVVSSASNKGPDKSIITTMRHGTSR
jgi:hypothetical protein